jgi:hypothetical protein
MAIVRPRGFPFNALSGILALLAIASIDIEPELKSSLVRPRHDTGLTKQTAQRVHHALGNLLSHHPPR